MLSHFPGSCRNYTKKGALFKEQRGETLRGVMPYTAPRFKRNDNR